MTTVKTEKRTESFEDAVKRARLRVMLGKSYHRGMSTEELEQRKRDLREYYALRKIAEIRGRDYCTATIGYFVTKG